MERAAATNAFSAEVPAICHGFVMKGFSGIGGSRFLNEDTGIPSKPEDAAQLRLISCTAGASPVYPASQIL
jgi:hypothetical protein